MSSSKIKPEEQLKVRLSFWRNVDSMLAELERYVDGREGSGVFTELEHEHIAELSRAIHKAMFEVIKAIDSVYLEKQGQLFKLLYGINADDDFEIDWDAKKPEEV